MSIFQRQPLQLPELGLHVAPSKVVAWAKSTLEKVRRSGKTLTFCT